MGNPQDKSLRQRDAEMFFISVLILYLELALIRWIGTEIRIFAYLGNLVLVVCFFGVGLGCFLATRPFSLTRMGWRLLLLVALISNPLHLAWLDCRKVTSLLSGFEDSPIWDEPILLWGKLASDVILGLGIVAGMMYLVVFTFVPLGQWLGRSFQEHPRLLRAYSVNIAGSLVGIWLFDLLSWCSSPPAIWFGVGALLLMVLVGLAWRPEWPAAALAILAAVLAWWAGTGQGRTIWSPYHKLTITPLFAAEGNDALQNGWSIEVNGTFYQQLVNLSDAFLKAHPSTFNPELAKYSHYNLPFSFGRPIRRMLIVGAGGGNNAAAALRYGVEQVDCVEIDPQIYALGRELHPEQPYDSPRVRVIVDDARAYFRKATGHYDAIWFALLDSHTLGSSYNNLRLDHYVYTIESFREARGLLAEDGLVILNFNAQRSWIARRLFGQLQEVFGADPIVYWSNWEKFHRQYGSEGGVAMICGVKPVGVQAIDDPSLREFVQSNLIQLAGQTRLTTDDWPYLYLERAKLPKLHFVVTIAILGAITVARRRVFGLRQGLDWHFFALGAAFLLLEVQTVSRATLLFGMTWVVNAIVISAVLVMILLANLVAWRWPRCPQGFAVAGLATTVLALALVPLDWFNVLTGASKIIAASAFLTAPVFFAGLIFIRSFAACADKSRALGSNLIGALAGGLLESVSFVTGIRALVLLVGAFYVVALLLRPGRAQNAQAAGQ